MRTDNRRRQVSHTCAACAQQTTSHGLPHLGDGCKETRSKFRRESIKSKTCSPPGELCLCDLIFKPCTFSLVLCLLCSFIRCDLGPCLERENAFMDRPRVRKCGRLIHVLAEECAEVLHNLVWRLADTMSHTKVNEIGNSNRGTFLKVQVLLVLCTVKQSFNGGNPGLALTPFMIPFTTGLTLSGVLLNATNAAANAAETRASC